MTRVAVFARGTLRGGHHSPVLTIVIAVVIVLIAVGLLFTRLRN